MTQKLVKKKYVTPKVTCYGAVRDMTQSSSGGNPEGTSGMVGLNPGYSK